MLWEALDKLKDFQTLLAALVACLGGLWALNAHYRRREHDPRIQMRVSVRFVGHHDGKWVVELLAFVENRGQVPHRMSGLRMNLLGFREGDPMTADASRYRGQLEFRHKLVPPDGGELSLMPEADDNQVVVYPGTSMRYMYVAAVDDGYRFLLIHATLSRRRAEPIRADRVVMVPRPAAAASSSSSAG